MKKLIFFCMLSAAAVAGNIYQCTLFSGRDFVTDTTTIYTDNETVGIINDDKQEIQLNFGDKFHHFKYVKSIEDVKLYENNLGFVVGVFSDFKNGVRLVAANKSFDLVDCIKIKEQ